MALTRASWVLMLIICGANACSVRPSCITCVELLLIWVLTRVTKTRSSARRKRIDNILDEVADKKDKVDNEKIKEKIELVEEKLRGISKENTLSTTNLKDVLLSLEMKDNLRLF